MDDVRVNCKGRDGQVKIRDVWELSVSWVLAHWRWNGPGYRYSRLQLQLVNRDNNLRHSQGVNSVATDKWTALRCQWAISSSLERAATFCHPSATFGGSLIPKSVCSKWDHKLLMLFKNLNFIEVTISGPATFALSSPSFWTCPFSQQKWWQSGSWSYGNLDNLLIY